MGVGVRVLLVAVVAASMLSGPGLAIAGERTPSVRVPFQDSWRPPVSTTITVTKGDHLWKIAREHLESMTGQLVSSGQIARHWRKVIELNLGRLRSGDPDLIYPGEVITLPEGPISGQP